MNGSDHLDRTPCPSACLCPCHRPQVIELPLKNPELFLRVGIKPPKGCLLYGPPGTGKTLLARAVASNVDANFLKVVSSAIVDKYIGESARVIREMFGQSLPFGPALPCPAGMGRSWELGAACVHDRVGRCPPAHVPFPACAVLTGRIRA